MPDRALVIIDHMLEAIAHLREDTEEGASLAFGADRRLRQLVECNLEIISEASRRIPNRFKAAHPQIPWRQIADTRKRPAPRVSAHRRE